MQDTMTYGEHRAMIARRADAILAERVVPRLRGYPPETTQAELGRRFGVSRERIRQHEAKLVGMIEAMAPRSPVGGS